MFEETKEPETLFYRTIWKTLSSSQTRNSFRDVGKNYHEYQNMRTNDLKMLTLPVLAHI